MYSLLMLLLPLWMRFVRIMFSSYNASFLFVPIYIYIYPLIPIAHPNVPSPLSIWDYLVPKIFLKKLKMNWSKFSKFFSKFCPFCTNYMYLTYLHVHLLPPAKKKPFFLRIFIIFLYSLPPMFPQSCLLSPPFLLNFFLP